MKRFWLVLLSLGLVLAFSASAMAVDVKFSGSFYAAGIYLDKTSLVKDNNISTAFYHQRLRVETDFIVSPGLKLVTRFDAMERIWGGARSDVGTTADSQSAGTRAENQNIAFEWAYVEYASPIGIFQAGYNSDNTWGTVFGDSASGAPAGQISYMLPIKDFLVGAMIFKEGELSRTSVTPSTTTDTDKDKYILWGMYNINKDINVGLLYVYVRNAMDRAGVSPSNGSLTTFHVLEPYAKVKIGPVSVEAELDYAWGKTKAEDGVIGSDVDIQSLMAYVNAVADFGMVYAGGTFAYISGDDPNTKDKSESFLDGGMDWNPCLIMFNQDITYWAGAINGYAAGSAITSNSSPMSNAWFGQGKVGVRPIAPLDIMASLSYATADKKPAGVLNSLYGWEIDVTGTYKLTNNLSYMLGVGYLFTGDYYKGDNNANSVTNNYILINKLTLTF